ncbi:MAG TPA: SPW repeat protein [Salinimicrobium sp.]|nr:SPW repeat protein [Salinimicrobium sp.]
MRFIETKAHGMLDYLMGVLLIISPWLFDFDNGGAAQWIPMILGFSTIFYSIITNYELGLLKIISMKTHLMIDLFSGILLAVSPWLFGFAELVYLPHLILGLAEIAASLCTKKQPSYPQATAG